MQNQAQPLEARIVKIGVNDVVSGVSAKLVTPLGFVPFFPEDNDSSEVVEFLNEDLSAVLRLSYVEFWSQVVHDPSLLSFFDMYLRYARRGFDLMVENSKFKLEAIKRSEPQQKLFKRVLQFIVRISSPTENERDFMSSTYHSKLIKDLPLFDVPRLFDICVLYADYNLPETKKVVEYLFENCSWFDQDLKQGIPVLSKVFTEMRKKLHKKNVKPIELKEVSKYVLDIFYTVQSFLTVYPKGAVHFSAFLQQLAFNYDIILPALSTQTAFASHLKFIMLNIASIIVNYYVDELSEGSGNRMEMEELAGQFYNMMRALTDNRKELRESSEGPYDPSLFGHFIKDLEKSHSFIKKIKQLAREDYAFMKGFNLALVIQDFDMVTGDTPTPKPAETQTAPDALDSPDMLKKIRNLKEIFASEYGDGYLALCIQAYGGNEERATHHIFDQDLPQHLLKADKKLSLTAALMTSGKVKPKSHATPNTTSRASIFAGSAFDLDSDVPINSEAVKVKGKHQADMNILNEKEHIHRYRDRYTDEMFSSHESSDSEDERALPLLKQRKALALYEDEPDDSREEFGVRLVSDGHGFDEPNSDEDDDGPFKTKNLNRQPPKPQQQLGPDGRPQKAVRGGQPPQTDSQQPVNPAKQQAGRGQQAGGGRGNKPKGPQGRGQPQQPQQPAQPAPAQPQQGGRGQQNRQANQPQQATQQPAPVAQPVQAAQPAGRGAGRGHGRGEQSSQNTKSGKQKQQHDRKARALGKESYKPVGRGGGGAPAPSGPS